MTDEFKTARTRVSVAAVMSELCDALELAARSQSVQVNSKQLAFHILHPFIAMSVLQSSRKPWSQNCDADR
jgi:hypothetical protein